MKNEDSIVQKASRKKQNDYFNKYVRDELNHNKEFLQQTLSSLDIMISFIPPQISLIAV